MVGTRSKGERKEDKEDKKRQIQHDRRPDFWWYAHNRVYTDII